MGQIEPLGRRGEIEPLLRIIDGVQLREASAV